MTVQTPESKVETNTNQEKPDTNLPQQNVELNTGKKEATEKPVDEDPNWKAFREARKKDRAEKEEAQRKAAEKEAEVLALKAAMEAAFSKNTPSPQAYQQYYGMNNVSDHDQEETEDSRIEKKVTALLAAKEQQYRREQEEREKQEYPNRLLKDFGDFNQVVSQENLDYIDFHYPEVSRPLQRLNDGYDKWHDIYKAIKKFVPNNTTAKKESARAENNFNKPKSMSTTNISPTGDSPRQTWQETEQRRTENWQRMQRIMKGI